MNSYSSNAYHLKGRYFFVPYFLKNKLHKIHDLSIDHVIIDLEDSVPDSELSLAISDMCVSSATYGEYWLRVPLIDMANINKLYQVGYRKFVLPKVRNAKELNGIFRTYQGIQIILLVENPEMLLDLNNIDRDILPNVHGMSLGTQDFAISINASRDDKNFLLARQEILYFCKAYNISAIDSASMNVSDQNLFDRELDRLYDSGYDAKFYLNPLQIKWTEEYKVKAELKLIEWAQAVVRASEAKGNSNEQVKPFILDGIIIEKPHVREAYKILNKLT